LDGFESIFGLTDDHPLGMSLEVLAEEATGWLFVVDDQEATRVSLRSHEREPSVAKRALGASFPNSTGSEAREAGRSKVRQNWLSSCSMRRLASFS
jgi:hypothetical protein